MATFDHQYHKSLKLVFAVAMSLALSLTTGCSEYLKFLLYNETTKDIVIVQEKGTIAIPPGGSALVLYPTPEQGWHLEMIVDRKRYSYIMPSRLDHLPWRQNSKPPLYLQIQADLSIYFVPPGLLPPIDTNLLASAQIDGFPIHAQVQ